MLSYAHKLKIKLENLFKKSLLCMKEYLITFF